MSIATATRIPARLPVRSDPEPAWSTTDHSREAVAEEHRWLAMLVIPFIVSATLFAAAIGTELLWLMGPAMVLGPGLIIIGFVYLALTSDSNGDQFERE